MSDYYAVKVVSRKGRTVDLAVETVHPDVDFARDAMNISFALMMLVESTDAAGVKGTALGAEASYDDVIEPEWASAFALGFIESAELVSLDGKHAVYRVTVTNAAWCKHFKPGLKWPARAFRVTEAFAWCDPIAPTGKRHTVGRKKKLSAADDSGVLVVPGQVFEGLGQDLGSSLDLARHARSAYRVWLAQFGPKLSPARLKRWEERLVEVTSTDGLCVHGALVARDEALFVARIDRDGAELVEIPWKSVERVGLLRLASKGPHDALLTDEDIIRRIPAVVCFVKRNKQGLNLLIQPRPDNTTGLDNEWNVLLLLALAFSRQGEVRPPPAFARELKKASAAPELAKKYLRKIVDKGAKPRPWPKTLEEILENGLRSRNVSIEVRDPKILAHWEAMTYAEFRVPGT